MCNAIVVLIIDPKSNAITEITPNFQKLQLKEFCDHILAIEEKYIG